MSEDFGGLSRWAAIRNTLVEPPDGVVQDLQSQIRFGLSMYTNEGGTCPDMGEMGPQLDAADEITTLLDGTGPGGDTPTGEALEAALQTLEQDTWDGEKFLVLATDGEPDTCDVPNPMTDPEKEMARSVAVQAVQAAYEAGVRTFVVSVGAEVAETHLQDLANAGVGNDPNDPDAPFYQALDQQSLIDAFDAIVSGVRECKLDLSEPLLPELAPSCEVTVNGSPIPFEDPDGWQQGGEQTIELLGSACSAIQEGVVSIAMTCTCEAG